MNNSRENHERFILFYFILSTHCWIIHQLTMKFSSRIRPMKKKDFSMKSMLFSTVFFMGIFRTNSSPKLFVDKWHLQESQKCHLLVNNFRLLPFKLVTISLKFSISKYDNLTSTTLLLFGPFKRYDVCLCSIFFTNI